MEDKVEHQHWLCGSNSCVGLNVTMARCQIAVARHRSGPVGHGVSGQKERRGKERDSVEGGQRKREERERMGVENQT